VRVNARVSVGVRARVRKLHRLPIYLRNQIFSLPCISILIDVSTAVVAQSTIVSGQSIAVAMQSSQASSIIATTNASLSLRLDGW
jgi:hypothetical protein